MGEGHTIATVTTCTYMHMPMVTAYYWTQGAVHRRTTWGWDRLARARGWLARSEDYDRQINANLKRTLEALVRVAWIEVVCVDLACVVCLGLTKAKTRRSLRRHMYRGYVYMQTNHGLLSERWKTDDMT
jgi:hypothetical protein